MADISQDLQKILDAIYGEEVRGSIHHAISLINDVSEVILTTGTDITAPTDSSEGYFTGSLYLNLDTYELWKCIGTNAWQSLGILKGATGDNGNKWYRGLAVSGKAVLPTVYPTGIANANANDYYLNPSEGAIYYCVTGGDDTTATWSYDFTMTGGGGGGSIVTWTQIQSSTGGVKIAEIDIDGSMQEVYAPEGGGMLPYLYIDSEAGATVTVNQPDGTVITPTAAGSGHWECELTGGYGTYVIHSVLSGQGDATQSLAVDTVKEYHVTDTHYDYTINVTAPNGSTVRIVGGGETYTGTGTGTSQAFAVHTASTAYTVAVTMDGNTKSETITSAATSGQSGSVNIAFGTINLTYANDFRGKTITCTKSGVTVTKTAPSSGNTMTLRVPTTGTWTISGEVSGQTYSVDAVVSSLSTAVSVNLQTVPDGKTVTPTDDIQIWLNCAGIYDKTSYTTLDDVLADSTTLLALMSDNNAVDYMVRSKTFIHKGLVPKMTSNTTPSGTVIAPNAGSDFPGYYAFDDDPSTRYSPRIADIIPDYVTYDFGSDNAKVCKSVSIINGKGTGDVYGAKDFKIRGSNDNSTWTDLYTGTLPADSNKHTFDFSNNETAYRYYQFYGTSAYAVSNPFISVAEIQYYSIYADHGITDDSTAMTDIGANNYAADTLLADEDWCEAICNSTYFESVLNVKVPTMTSNTTPSGIVTASSEVEAASAAFHAFNGVEAVTDRWGATATTGWIQYEYTSSNSNKVYRVDIIPLCEANVSKAKHCILEAGTTYDRIGAFDTVFTGANSLQNQIFVLAHKYLTTYQTYRLSVTNDSGNVYIIGLQYYGRKDV